MRAPHGSDWAETVGRRKQHAGSPERDKGGPGDRTQADRPGRIIPRPAGQEGLCHSPSRGEFGTQLSRGRITFDQARHGIREKPVADSAASDHSRLPTSSQREPDASDISSIVSPVSRDVYRLWAAHLVNPGKNFRLVLAHHSQFGRGEARHRVVAGHLSECWECGLQVRAFGGRANVVPQDGWTQHGPVSSRSTAPCIWPDGSFPVFRDVLNTVLTEANALIDPMTKEKRVAYSFRHFFATKLIELGLSVAQIAEWFGTRARWSRSTTSNS